MTDRGSRWLRRPASLAGRILVAAFWSVWEAVKILFSFIIILTFPFARFFILLPLSVAMLGGGIVAIYFACCGAWADAGSASLVAIVSGLLFGGYCYVVEKVDPSLGASPRPMRWRDDWWD